MRLRQLDVLRAVAVLMVLGHHIPDLPDTAPAVVAHVATVWQRCGWAGVDLFFVLSGFLVSGLLFREFHRKGEIRLGYFLIRRGLKIYPGFYVTLVLTAPLAVYLGTELTGWTLFVTGAFLQNYWFADLPRLWGHTWSLAIEEHFYFAIGAFMLLLTRVRSRDPFGPLRLAFTAVPFVVLALRILTVRRTDAFDAVFYPTHLRCDSLLFGVALAYQHHLHPERLAAFVGKWFWPLVLGGLALVAPSLVLEVDEGLYMRTVGVTGLYLGFGALLLAALHWPRPAPRLLDPVLGTLAAIGVYSYSIYLWHIPVHLYTESMLRMILDRPPYLLRFALYAGGSLAIGILMAKLVELPLLRVRDRVFPSRSDTAPRPVAGVAPGPGSPA